MSFSETRGLPFPFRHVALLDCCFEKGLRVPTSADGRGRPEVTRWIRCTRDPTETRVLGPLSPTPFPHFLPCISGGDVVLSSLVTKKDSNLYENVTPIDDGPDSPGAHTRTCTRTHFPRHHSSRPSVLSPQWGTRVVSAQCPTPSVGCERERPDERSQGIGDPDK